MSKICETCKVKVANLTISDTTLPNSIICYKCASDWCASVGDITGALIFNSKAASA
jgi:hypothetical protein